MDFFLRHELVKYAKASAVAYNDPTLVTNVHWIVDRETEVCITHDWNEVTVAFRGTSSLRDVLTDVKFLRVTAPLAGTAHRGFVRAYNYVKVALHDHVDKLLRTRSKLTVCGHSLGAALAQLCAADFVKFHPVVFTYGSPRVGCHRFARAFDKAIPHYRVVRNNDAVTGLPPNVLGLVSGWPTLYWHTGTEYYINRNGRVTVEPSAARVIFDRVLGRLRHPLKGVKDHPIGAYVRALRGAE